VRTYLLSLRQGGAARGTFQTSQYGLRFLYQHTLGRAWRLMWTAPELATPEVASRIWSARTPPLAPPISAVSPVQSLLAAACLEIFNMTAQLRHGVEGFRCRAVCRAETGPACRPTSAPRQPTVPVDCADRPADGIGQSPAASSAQPRR